MKGNKLKLKLCLISLTLSLCAHSQELPVVQFDPISDKPSIILYKQETYGCDLLWKMKNMYALTAAAEQCDKDGKSLKSIIDLMAENEDSLKKVIEYQGKQMDEDSVIHKSDSLTIVSLKSDKHIITDEKDKLKKDLRRARVWGRVKVAAGAVVVVAGYLYLHYQPVKE